MSLDYSTEEGDVVTVKIGLSYTSVENAEKNMLAEAADASFDDVMEATMAKWNDELNKIRVYGGTEESRVKFYTGLYHALLGRGLASDVNGAYPKNDGSVGQIPLGSLPTTTIIQMPYGEHTGILKLCGLWPGPSITMILSTARCLSTMRPDGLATA